jgi:hypothetical protein
VDLAQLYGLGPAPPSINTLNGESNGRTVSIAQST